MKFNELNLSENLLRAIDDVGYISATEIQQRAIPIMLEGKDVIGLSQTGSGKTATFSIPALEAIDASSNVAQLLVIAPTRELAMQIAGEIQKLSKYMNGINVATVFGGDSMPKQIKALKHANVVVGTPGRLQDHIRRRTLMMKHLKFIVLDEADEMLNMGFYDDIVNILDKTPEEKQMALFSATMPREIKTLANDFLKSPETVSVITKENLRPQIDQYFYYVNMRQKRSALMVLLQYYNPERAIIFTNTRRMTDEIAEILRSKNISASALHGDIPQNIRTGVLNEFRKGQLKYLVATDVAARGIDVDDVDLVVNFDLPQTNEYYVHRIGRTGRAGKSGVSITLASTRNQLHQLQQIKRMTKAEIIERALPTKEDVEKQIVKAQSQEILNALDGDIHPLAVALVENLINESGNQLNDIGISYLIANKLVKQVIDSEELETIEQLTKPAVSRKGHQKTKVRVSLGRKDSLRPKDLAMGIVRGINVKPADVGDIKLFKNYSLVLMEENTAQKLIKKGSLRIGKEMANFEFFKGK